MEWIKFEIGQPLPPERRRVLVETAARDGLRPAVAVGYLRYAADDLHSPYFVIPGVGGAATHWCDCLADTFGSPSWPSSPSSPAPSYGHPAGVWVPPSDDCQCPGCVSDGETAARVAT